MPFEYGHFWDLMPDTISIYSRVSHNNYGEASYSTAAVSYRARVLDNPRWVRNQFGEIIEETNVLWVGSTANIEADVKIVLPDGTSPPIIRMERYPDQTGRHHTKITFGYLGGRRRS